MTDWDTAIAAVELFRAEADLEVQDLEYELRKEWKGMTNEDRKMKFPWQDDPSNPPSPHPSDQISKMAIYDRKELVSLLQVAPPEALRELYDQIHGGPREKAWKHGVAELGLLLRQLFLAQVMKDKRA